MNALPRKHPTLPGPRGKWRAFTVAVSTSLRQDHEFGHGSTPRTQNSPTLATKGRKGRPVANEWRFSITPTSHSRWMDPPDTETTGQGLHGLIVLHSTDPDGRPSAPGWTSVREAEVDGTALGPGTPRRAHGQYGDGPITGVRNDAEGW